LALQPEAQSRGVCQFVVNTPGLSSAFVMLLPYLTDFYETEYLEDQLRLRALHVMMAAGVCTPTPNVIDRESPASMAGWLRMIRYAADVPNHRLQSFVPLLPDAPGDVLYMLAELKNPQTLRSIVLSQKLPRSIAVDILDQLDNDDRIILEARLNNERHIGEMVEDLRNIRFEKLLNEVVYTFDYADFVKRTMIESQLHKKPSVNAGWIYVLVNSTMPNLVKIGKTTRHPENRAKELGGSTGVASPFIVAFSEKFDNIHKAEQVVHALLNASRLSDKREFFSSVISGRPKGRVPGQRMRPVRTATGS
jgi:hypothetical protein